MRGFYIHRHFFIVLLGFIFAALLAFIYPVLYAWVVWGLCLFAMGVVADFVLLYSFGPVIKAERIMAEKFSNGEENPVIVRLENQYPFAIRGRIIDEIPSVFQLRDLRLPFSLAPGEKSEQTYYLRPVKRGQYAFGRLHIFVHTRWSLLERRYSFAGGDQIAVYPSFMAMQKYELLALAGQRAGNGIRRIRVSGVTTSFEQIKPYTQGDDPRTINWKTTAKYNHLMVNSYTEERSQAIYCLIDQGRTMQSPFGGMTMLDYAINASLVLSNVVLKRGDKAGMLTFANKSGTLIKADDRRLQLNRISEALYNQKTDFLESDFEQLCITFSRYVHTRSMLVLFTNFDTVTGMQRHLPALRRLARNHLVLLILFENTEINRVVTEPAAHMQDIYFKVVAGDFIFEKKRIARELRNVGIYTILTEPEKLTANAINGYLEMKERGLV